MRRLLSIGLLSLQLGACGDSGTAPPGDVVMLVDGGLRDAALVVVDSARDSPHPDVGRDLNSAADAPQDSHQAIDQANDLPLADQAIDLHHADGAGDLPPADGAPLDSSVDSSPDLAPDTGTCGFASCPNGCCDTANNICITATTNAQCGSGGSACHACNTGETCLGANCIADSTSYDVFVVSADATQTSCANDPAENGCDVTVLVGLGPQGGQTPVVPDSNVPVWNFKIFTSTQGTLLSTPLLIITADDDGASGQESLDSMCFGSVTPGTLAASQLVVDCAQVKALTFSFQRIP